LELLPYSLEMHSKAGWLCAESSEYCWYLAIDCERIPRCARAGLNSDVRECADAGMLNYFDTYLRMPIYIDKTPENLT